MFNRGNKLKIAGLIAACSILCGCNTMSKVLNPFQETPPPEAYLGEKNDNALNEGQGKAETARTALESMSSYQRAQAPQPYNPVVQPAVVRLMWVPDRLNKHGDLVPAHYYYLKVLQDRWALQDAFELEGQLSRKGDIDATIPFASEKDAEQ